VVFGFGQGQELSEHTVAKPAMLFFVKSEATVGLGDEVKKAQPGTWVHMPANLKHSTKARTPVDAAGVVEVTAPHSPKTPLPRPLNKQQLGSRLPKFKPPLHLGVFGVIW
jgi:quercetin dioxygenase-like cupin family protein